MKKKYLSIALVTFIIVLLIASPAIADALYRGTVRVTNSGTTAATDTSVNFTLNSTSFTSNGYALPDFSDVSIQSNGVELAFMPGYSTNPWMVFAPLVGAGQYIDYDLYAKGAMGGKLCYFPGDTGMTIADNETMELGNEFRFLIEDCYIDTVKGADKYIIYKLNACNFAVSSTTTGTITFSIIGKASVSTASVPSGEYDIEITANVTHLKLYLNSVPKGIADMTGNVTDNNNAWTFFKGNTVKYVRSIELIK